MKENKYTISYCVCENFSDSFYYGSGSGSGTVINNGSGSDFLARYGSGSASQKVTVPTVLVPQRCPTHLQLSSETRSGSAKSKILEIFNKDPKQDPDTDPETN
jgi:hypothetical protein